MIHIARMVHSPNDKSDTENHAINLRKTVLKGCWEELLSSDANPSASNGDMSPTIFKMTPVIDPFAPAE